tara:strand:- start:3441 stop:4487 length:1047 start_codon:yes stop_codon:yes gene_type:complete
MPRQLSLHETARPRQKRFTDPLVVDVVDLFCGIGGTSAGARWAGHRVRLAVETEQSRLAVHAKNHPECQHLSMDLPSDKLLDYLPQPNTLWHLHGSPPCQNLSLANGGNVREKEEKAERTEVGLDLVCWFLDLVNHAKPATWSMEQVNHPEVLAELDGRGLHYVVCKMEQWGLPQCRCRVIAGSEHLIRRFEGLREPTRLVAVRDVLHLPVPGARLKGSCATYSKKSKPGSNESRVVPLIKRSRPATRPSLTVIGVGHTLVWCDSEGHSVRQLTPAENGVLQGFPPNYILFQTKKDSNIAIGDAFPPFIAKKLLSNYRLPLNLYPDNPAPAVFPKQPWFRPESPSLAL